MLTPAACLLLRKFLPATARLFAEFRRLRDRLPPAEARKFAECQKDGLRDAELMTLVRLCACLGCTADGQVAKFPPSALRGGGGPDAFSCETTVHRGTSQAASKSSGNLQEGPGRRHSRTASGSNR